MRSAVLIGAFALAIGINLIVFSPVPNGKQLTPSFRFVPLISVLDGIRPGRPGLFHHWPRPTDRYYYRTWPPGVGFAAGGLALLGVGVCLRRRRPTLGADRAFVATHAYAI